MLRGSLTTRLFFVAPRIFHRFSNFLRSHFLHSGKKRASSKMRFLLENSILFATSSNTKKCCDWMPRLFVKYCFTLQKCKENGGYRKNSICIFLRYLNVFFLRSLKVTLTWKRRFKQTKTVFMHLITTELIIRVKIFHEIEKSNISLTLF